MGDNSDNVAGLKGLGEKTLIKIFPYLTIMPTSLSDLMRYASTRLELQEKGELKLSASEKRWFPVILANEELVRQNLEIMQLTSPIISATAASTIRHAVQEVKPEFNITNFKLSLINSGIQLSDNDLFPTFNEYKMRVTNAVA
jgi:5'-3' exonuclease